MRSNVGLVLVAFACGVCVLQTRAALPAYPFAVAVVGVGALAATAALIAWGRLHFAAIATLACIAGFVSGFGYAGWRAGAGRAGGLGAFTIFRRHRCAVSALRSPSSEY